MHMQTSSWHPEASLSPSNCGVGALAGGVLSPGVWAAMGGLFPCLLRGMSTECAHGALTRVCTALVAPPGVPVCALGKLGQEGGWYPHLGAPCSAGPGRVGVCGASA